MTSYFPSALTSVSFLNASAGVAPKRIFEAIKVIKEEFTQLGDGTRPFTEEELASAKEYLIGTMTLSFEDSRSVAQYYGLKQLLTNEVSDPSEFIEKIKAATLEEINSLVAEIITTDGMRLAVIGPYKSTKKFQDLLG